MTQGLQIASSSWNGSTFVLPSKDKLGWVEVINEYDKMMTDKKRQEEFDSFVKGRNKHDLQGFGYVYTKNPDGITGEEIRFAEKFKKELASTNHNE